MEQTKQNFRQISGIVAISSILGGCFAFFQSARFGSMVFISGCIDGFLISFFLSVYTVFIINGFARRALRKLTVSITFLSNAIVYTFIILFGRALGMWIRNDADFELLSKDEDFTGAVLFAAVLSIVINFLFQMGRFIPHCTTPAF